MTKDQFAYWLVGYITVHKVDAAALDPDDAQLIGSDVLEAARSVGGNTARLNAEPLSKPSEGAHVGFSGRMFPQPGDLDYEDTSTVKQK